MEVTMEKLEKETVQNHASATQEIYDEVYAALKHKFDIDLKGKLQETRKKLSEAHNQEIRKLEYQYQA